MTKPIRYFVTPVGMASALANADLLDTINGVLLGNGHPMTVRSLLKRGYIELERRNPLGALKEVRGVLLQNPQSAVSPLTPTPSSGPVTYQFHETPALPRFTPTVERVLTAARSLTGTVTYDTLHTHSDLKDLNPGTLRWAIQVLRRAGLCSSSRSDLAA